MLHMKSKEMYYTIIVISALIFTTLIQAQSESIGANAKESYPLSFFEEFIRGGGDCNAELEGNRLLYVAAQSQDHCASIRFLMSQQSDVNASNTVGAVPLHMAAKKGCLICLQLLIRGGARLDIQDSQGWTAVHCAANRGQIDCLTALLDEGANIDDQDAHGMTALHHAAVQGHMSCVITLTERGAHIHARSFEGWTAVHCAANRGQIDCLTALLDEGANIDDQDAHGMTALHHAAIQGHMSCVITLTERGAHIAPQGYDDWTVLDYAADELKIDCLKALIQVQANRSRARRLYTLVQTDASLLDEINTAMSTLATDEEIFDKYCKGTALHYAAARGHVACLNTILDTDADIDTSYPDAHGLTPLHYAAMGGHSKCLIALLVRGGNIHAECSVGRTPLHLAASKGCVKSLKVLLDEGAIVEAQDFLGRTALYEAAIADHGACLMELIAKGVNIDAQDDRGYTALDIAVLVGSEDCIGKLIDALTRQAEQHSSPQSIYPTELSHNLAGYLFQASPKSDSSVWHETIKRTYYTALRRAIFNTQRESLTSLLKKAYILVPLLEDVIASKRRIAEVLLLFAVLRKHAPSTLTNLSDPFIQFTILSFNRVFRKDLAIILLHELKHGRKVTSDFLIRSKPLAHEYLKHIISKMLNEILSEIPSQEIVKLINSIDLIALISNCINERW
jgi:ankyrin repeat protein